MLALRVCVGTVSSEQRRSNGSSAAIAVLPSAGVASIAVVAATNLRRDIDLFMLLLLVFVLSSVHSESPLGAGAIDQSRCDAVRRRDGLRSSKDEADAGHDEQRVDG